MIGNLRLVCGPWMAMMALLLLSVPKGCAAWDTEEMDLFDLVEEVNMNFYDFLGVEQSSSSGDIRKAYKKLALQLHPDKNDAPDAEIQFRQLAGIYEVLKDKTMRERYDTVLVEGLPDWKMPAFYFRRMRKINLLEGLLYLLVIATGIQYCMNWAAHWEHKFNLSERQSAEAKRRQKRMKKEGFSEQEIVALLREEEQQMEGSPPTMHDTLPFQLFRLIKSIPSSIGHISTVIEERRRLKEEMEREEREAEDELRLKEEEKQKRKEAKAKKKNVKMYKEVTLVESTQVKSTATSEVRSQPEAAVPRNANQMWTDEDLATLAKFIKKYPGGTSDRWDRIGGLMERYPAEVTEMAAKIKHNPSLVPISTAGQGVTGRENNRIVSDEVLEDEALEDEYSENETGTEDDVDEDGYLIYSPQKAEEYVPVDEKKKKKTKGDVIEPAEDQEEDVWSQDQQKALETALKDFPKGCAERWDRIAGKVSGKNKEQCMLRFKHIADLIKKKKESAD